MSDLIPNLPCILVIDDDTDHLFLTRKMLKKAEVRNPIVEIPGGLEAIDYLAACCLVDNSAEKKLPALIFLDLKMPKVDGYTVLGWIRSNSALREVKVVILTSSNEPEDVKLCANLGAQAFLIKHPNPMVIGSMLRQILGEPVPQHLAVVTRELEARQTVGTKLMAIGQHCS